MIILNNRLYSCEQCLLENEGQKCGHFQDILVSVARSKCYAEGPLGFSQGLVGKYRLIITKAPTISKTIQLSKHSDEEVLFNKQLGVDVLKSVGKIIYILEESTPVDISYNKEYLDQKVALPFGIFLKPYRSHDEAELSRRSSCKGTIEPVIVRPLSRVNPRNHPDVLLRNDPVPVKVTQTFDDITKQNVHSIHPLHYPTKLEASVLNRQQKQLLGCDGPFSKFTQIDQFLNETQAFLHDFGVTQISS